MVSYILDQHMNLTMFGGFKVDLAFTAFSHEDGSKYH